MTIKGILYKRGVNGLGVGPMWMRMLLPYRHRFDDAAKEHDGRYDACGTWRDRRMADFMLLTDMVRLCGNDLQVIFSIGYYFMVRAFGWLFFKYKFK